MHTPEQAKELWCPMVRIARREPVAVLQEDGSTKSSEVAFYQTDGNNTDALGGNRVPASCRCIADQCAMWQWHPTTLLHPDTGALTMNGPGGITDRIPAKGFCGLAGRQELL